MRAYRLQHLYISALVRIVLVCQFICRGTMVLIYLGTPDFNTVPSPSKTRLITHSTLEHYIRIKQRNFTLTVGALIMLVYFVKLKPVDRCIELNVFMTRVIRHMFPITHCFRCMDLCMKSTHPLICS